MTQIFSVYKTALLLVTVLVLSACQPSTSLDEDKIKRDFIYKLQQQYRQAEQTYTQNKDYQVIFSALTIFLQAEINKVQEQKIDKNNLIIQLHSRLFFADEIQGSIDSMLAERISHLSNKDQQRLTDYVIKFRDHSPSSDYRLSYKKNNQQWELIRVKELKPTQ